MRLDLIPNTPEWHAHRSGNYNASEAAAMLGIDRNGMTRTNLLRMKAAGVEKEFSEWVQKNILENGHEIEAIARTFAEEFLEMDIGVSLDPCVFAEEIDGLPLSASLDGYVAGNFYRLNGINWECKTLNAGLREMVPQGIIPDAYHPQMEQGLMLSGASRCLFTASDGTRDGTFHAWYEANPALRSKIIASWKQFQADLEAYQPEPIVQEVTGRAPETLPALHVEVTGMVTSSNLLAFKETALAVFRGINTNLQTDADFADAEKTVKWCKDVEDRLEQTKQHALSQTASIDELFRTMDGIKEEARTVRLKLDKLVKGEKENRKAEIVMAARQAIELHVAELNKRIGGAWLPATSAAPFAEAIKGLKSLDSMRDKIGAALANAKVEASAIADRIELNRKCIDDAWMFLLPDFSQICTKDPADFARLYGERIQMENDRAASKLEAERARIRAEEQAKAEREAQAKAQAEQDARDAETARQRALEQERMRQEREAEQSRIAADQKEAIRVALEAQRAEQAAAIVAPVPVLSDKHVADANAVEFVDSIPDTGATMKLGEICERLGFAVTAQFLAGIGFEPVGHERAAKLYRECDFRAICIALVKHITGLYAVKESA